MSNEEIAVQIEHHRNEIESLKHRMKDCEEQQCAFAQLVRSVDRLALNMEYMAKEQQKQGERLASLEHEPTEDFRHYKRLIIGCFITGVLSATVTAVLSLILK